MVIIVLVMSILKNIPRFSIVIVMCVGGCLIIFIDHGSSNHLHHSDNVFNLYFAFTELLTLVPKSLLLS